ncbi:MAG TPA: NAD(P)-dependent oxidoreductase [Rhodocyclaceae bacterium]|nr:NAD(P)-dependent oxidoreductase [Rhodocyclaceae bacterium]HNH35067.1 NAD(P)-dependent oxidoreductase [Rhodocyclaceae bacterium]
MDVAVIGLGAMGRPMAENLLRAGHRVAVFARRPEARRPLAQLGARECLSPADAARGAAVAISVVTGNADVEEVALGSRGVIEGAARGAVFVDMSTIAPAVARRIGDRLAERDIPMLDAPVSGGAVGARAATLSIMVGGDANVLERVRPVFDVLGKTVVHIGPRGAGQVAKACNQMVMVAAIEACAEAARLASASGVDFARVREAMLGGSAGSRVLDVFGGRMAQRDFAAGVEARLHHKDFAILHGEAAASGVPLPVAASVWQQLNALMARGWGGEDTAALLRVLEAAGAATR